MTVVVSFLEASRYHSWAVSTDTLQWLLIKCRKTCNIILWLTRLSAPSSLTCCCPCGASALLCQLLAGLCALRFSSPPDSVHEVACSGVNFPTAFSSILDSKRFVRLSFKTLFRYHLHTAFPDLLSQRTFSTNVY